MSKYNELLESCTEIIVSPKSNFGCEFGIFQANRNHVIRKSTNNESDFLRQLEMFYGSDCDLICYNKDGDVLYEQNRKKRERKTIKKQVFVKQEPKVNKSEIDKTSDKAKNLVNRVLGNKQRKNDSSNFGEVKKAIESAKVKSKDDIAKEAKEIGALLKKSNASKAEYVELYAKTFGVAEKEVNYTVSKMKEELTSKVRVMIDILKEGKQDE